MRHPQRGRRRSGFPLGRLWSIRSRASCLPFSMRRRNQIRFSHYLLAWLSISIGMHAFPSDQDAVNVLARSKNSLTDGGSFFHYLAYPFFWAIWLANKLRFFWFDLLYAFALFSIGWSLSS